jgi:hypothetical protein
VVIISGLLRTPLGRLGIPRRRAASDSRFHWLGIIAVGRGSAGRARAHPSADLADGLGVTGPDDGHGESCGDAGEQGAGRREGAGGLPLGEPGLPGRSGLGAERGDAPGGGVAQQPANPLTLAPLFQNAALSLPRGFW